MAVDVDAELYDWIKVANESRERFNLPVGVIEHLVHHLKTALGETFLSSQLEKSKFNAGLMSESINPLRTWLHGPNVDKHVLQLLELGALLKFFEQDACLPDKIEKLKRDALWPVMFELAVARRLKMVTGSTGRAGLCNEQPDAVGDSYVISDNRPVARECSRLGYPPEEEEQFKILDKVYQYIGDVVKGSSLFRCVKIKITEPLTGKIFNPRLVGRIKKANNSFEKGQKLSRSSDLTIDVTVEPLTELTEQIPFAMVEGRIYDVAGSSWTSATSMAYVPASDEKHFADLYRSGVPFREIEHTRVFIEFPRAKHRQDPYQRLNQKIKSKLTQTKLPEQYAGRLIFIEWTFGLAGVDFERIRSEILDRTQHTTQTIGVIICSRQGTPRYRHHLASTGSLNMLAMKAMPNLKRSLNLFTEAETAIDPITGERYTGSWEEALKQIEEDEKAAELKEKSRGSLR